MSYQCDKLTSCTAASEMLTIICICLLKSVYTYYPRIYRATECNAMHSPILTVHRYRREK